MEKQQELRLPESTPDARRIFLRAGESTRDEFAQAIDLASLRARLAELRFSARLAESTVALAFAAWLGHPAGRIGRRLIPLHNHRHARGARRPS